MSDLITVFVTNLADLLVSGDFIAESFDRPAKMPNLVAQVYLLQKFAISKTIQKYTLFMPFSSFDIYH